MVCNADCFLKAESDLAVTVSGSVVLIDLLVSGIECLRSSLTTIATIGQSIALCRLTS